MEGRYTDSYTCGGISYSSLYLSVFFMCTAWSMKCWDMVRKPGIWILTLVNGYSSLFVSTLVRIYYVYCTKYEVYWYCVKGRYTDSYINGRIFHKNFGLRSSIHCNMNTE